MRTLPFIWQYINVSEDITDCWLWLGPIRPDGYASYSFWEDGIKKTKIAHRLVYEQLVTLIPEGLELDHLCKIRHCVNPAHLEPVTPKENHHRSDVTLHQTSKTHCPHGHLYDEENTYRYPRGSRSCRTCHRERMRRVYQRRREGALAPC